MKYIDKSKEKSQLAAKALHDWRNSFKDKNGKSFEEICKELDSEKAWNLIYEYGNGLKRQIRIALDEEQNGICCYCCQGLAVVLALDLTEELRTIIEHFLSKADDVCENTYNYYNLLLSCNGNSGDISGQPRKYQPNKGKDTWENAAVQIIQRHEKRNPDFTISADDLKRMNPLQAKNVLAKGQIVYELSPQHCDNYKGDDTRPIVNPASERDCWDRFRYDNKGFIYGLDEKAEVTIDVLNLNAKVLEKKRADKWVEFDEEYNKNPEVSAYFDNENWVGLTKYIESEFEKEVGGNLSYPFCVVRRAFLKETFEKVRKISA